jgi:hypothetical protein
MLYLSDKDNFLSLFKKTIAVYSGNCGAHLNTIWWHSARIFDVSPYGARSSHYDFKGQLAKCKF